MSEAAIKFNHAQQSAVLHQAGPMLVVAGAGTGKTSVLIGRLINLLLKHQVPSEAVLLLTFTEKAASEIEERADRLLPYGYFDAQISTFHSFAEKILREYGLEIGLPIDFKLLTTVDQWVFLKQNLDLLSLDYYRPLGNPNKFISELLKHFSRLKDENISSRDYWDFVESLDLDQDDIFGSAPIKRRSKKEKNEEASLDAERLKELANAYQVYNQLLLDNSYLDFGDLIIYCLRLFKQRPNLLQQLRQRYRHIMVDEFQDTNWAQYELVKQLAAPDNNLLVVGDDDQAIYKFRGASLANIMQFKEDFPQAKEVLLTENYRSQQEILDRAYQCVSHNNPHRLEIKLGIDKKLISRVPAVKEPAVTFSNFPQATNELFFVAKTIQDIYQTAKKNSLDISWSDFAILARSNETAETFSRELSRRQIPNQFVSLRGLYRKSIILDCLAYLRVLNDFKSAASLFRLFNLPAFSLPYPEIIKLNNFAQKKHWSLLDALEQMRVVPNISQEAVSKGDALLKLLNQHYQLAKSGKASQIFLSFVRDSGLITHLDYDRDQEQFSYLNQFYKKIKNFEESLPLAKLSDFLEILDWEMEAGDSGSLTLDFVDNDTVRVMTVHAAKGLEFKYVFLVGLSERKFPTTNRQDRIAMADQLIKEKINSSADSHLEEERRLFYVAMTRAKNKLFLSAWRNAGATREKKISRFVSETGLIDVNIETPVDLKPQPLNDDLQENQDVLLTSNQDLVLPTKFSFSQLAAFDNCPLQYKFAFVLKIPAPTDKASLIFGRVMHTVLYEFLKPLAIGGQADLFAKQNTSLLELNWERLEKIFKERWVEDGYQSKEERNKYYQQGRQALKKFLQQINQQVPTILFLEKSFSFHLDQDTIKGTIDRVDKLADGSLSVIDYKTGEAKEELNYKNKRQLILYQIFLEKILGLKVSSLSYYYLNSGEILSFVASDKEKSKLEVEIKQQIAEIKEKKFLPKPSLMCHYCDFKDICPWRQL